MIDYDKVPSPCYVVDEQRLRNNLSLIREVSNKSGAEIILAFKAFALWKLFPIFREYISSCTASSLGEAEVAYRDFGSLTHTYAPVYKDSEFEEIAKRSSHITFNSLSQYEKYKDRLTIGDRKISAGLRINPEYSAVETDLYNPCAPGSRLGVTSDKLKEELPDGIEGLHCHTLCESTSYELEKTISVIEDKFGHLLDHIKWMNFGGGHLMTRDDYNCDHLVSVIKSFRERHPTLKVILEPGSAFAWRTGELVSQVQDIVENKGIKTAILDVSFACHMPDCLEMPYKPAILNATDEIDGKPTYRMGGNSCLSGDFVGNWSFDNELKPGDRIIFLDMIHYTTVKTTMFNGISHPSIALWTTDNKLEMLRDFPYTEYRERMC